MTGQKSSRRRLYQNRPPRRKKNVCRLETTLRYWRANYSAVISGGTGMAAKYLTKDEERALIARAQSGDLAARNTLIERNLGLIYGCCRKVAARYRYPAEELVGDATEIFIKSIARFDMRFGRLSTYAVRAMTQSLYRIAFEFGGAIKVSGGLSSRALLARTSPETVAAMRAARRPVSIDYRTEQTPTFAETLAFRDEPRDERPPPYPDWPHIAAALAALDERSQGVLRMRMDGKTLVEVGDFYGISKERARQIEAKAHDAIRLRFGYSKKRSVAKRRTAGAR